MGSTRLCVLPSFLLSRRFLGSLSLVFSEFWHNARNPYEDGVTVLPQNLAKWTKNGPKTGFLKFIERFGHYFLLNLFYDENILSVVAQISYWKIFVPEIWAKNVLSESDCRMF